ncbi:hypothetical protein KAR91_56160 [Candidatus Pacearchaeota archaeon]|nr:hypothetical protein [Candidatus Pacearchaeota archaeon]
MNPMQSPNTGNLGEIEAKGGPGNECARSACGNKPAIGYNRSTGMWYCKSCTALLNKENKKEALRLFGGPLVIIPNTESLND